MEETKRVCQRLLSDERELAHKVVVPGAALSLWPLPEGADAWRRYRSGGGAQFCLYPIRRAAAASHPYSLCL